MSYEWQEVAGKQVLFCTGPQGHIECGELRTELLSALDTKSELVLDLSEVSEAGTIFVQLYLSAKATADQKGMPCELVNPSAVALAAFERIGMEIGG